MLKSVTQLVVEPVYEAPIFELDRKGHYEGDIKIETPKERDVFAIRCHDMATTQWKDMKLDVGDIVPSNDNKRGAPITSWRVPIKLSLEVGKTKINH